MTFNMAVELAYEEITDTPFNVADLKKQRNSLALCLASLVVADPATDVTVERLLHEATGQEIAELTKAVGEAMAEWLAIPAVMAEEEPKEGDGSPN